MIGTYYISASPINRRLIFNPEKYTRNGGAAKNDEFPEPVNILITFFFAGKKIQNRPNQQKKKGYTVPVKKGVYSFNAIHGHQKYRNTRFLANSPL